MTKDRENRDQQNKYEVSTPGNLQEGHGPKDLSPEEREEQIKNEPNTRRLRSERQSVIDGEKEETGE